MSNQRNIIVIGGGAAGMIGAIAAAKEGCAVSLYEKNILFTIHFINKGVER